MDGEGPGSHEYRMNVERAGDAQFGGEKTSGFLQALPEKVLHVEVGENNWVADVGTP